MGADGGDAADATVDAADAAAEAVARDRVRRIDPTRSLPRGTRRPPEFDAVYF